MKGFSPYYHVHYESSKEFFSVLKIATPCGSCLTAVPQGVGSYCVGVQ